MFRLLILSCILASSSASSSTNEVVQGSNSNVSSSPGEDIRAIKSLLAKLFSSYKSGMATLSSSVEAAETRMKAAESRVQAAESKMQAAESGMRTSESRIEAAESTIQAAETRLRSAESSLESLSKALEAAEAKWEAAGKECTARIGRLEEFLSRTQRSAAATVVTASKEEEASSSTTGRSALEDRLQRLEELTKFSAARTCHELKVMGVSKSGSYFLDPDGPGMGFKPVQVFCDMRTGTTRLDHDAAGEVRVSSCREKGCFVHRVQYQVPMAQMSALMGLSGHCEQHIRYDCLGAPLNHGNTSLAWWKDRHDRTHTYWAGNGSTTENSNNTSTASVCQCGLESKCGGDARNTCHCDDQTAVSSAGQWATDEGHLTHRSQLPVTQLNFGEVDGRAGKAARFQLGPVYCSGFSAVASVGPESCKDLWQSGVTKVGYYMVKAPRARYPKVVFCDMSKEVGVTGFERIFGSPGNLRYFAAFDVSLDRPFYDDFRYINFTSSSVNTGNAFNTRDGIFRAPYSGTYLFSVHAMPVEGRPFVVQIHRNGAAVAVLSNGETGTGMVGQSILLDVAVGDEIRLFNFGGDIFDDVRTNESFFHFVGVMLSSSDRE